MGIKIGVLGGCNPMPGLGKGSKGKGASGNGKPGADTCCELPSNPFKGGNTANNPFSLYGRVSNFINGLLGSTMCVENQMTDSILNPDSKANPNFLIFRKFQISALLGRAYDFLKTLAERVKADREATKDAYQVGFAA